MKRSPRKRQIRASLIDRDGQRKYLTPSEREAFLKAAEDADRETRTFCHVLAFTGCRISEALALTASRIDFRAGVIVIETLKKRERGIYRPVPVPPASLASLDMVHNVRQAQKRKDRGKNAYLWPWARNTAWRHVCAVMKAAGIKGPHASPKGLKHGYGIKALSSGVPLNVLKDVLGHAQLTTTMLYAEAMGEEKRQLIERMW